jgi:3-oxoacyl-[acyl-carrier-protein] synthase III
MPLYRSVVRGVGGYLPEECLKNADLESSLNTTDAWIVERTGMLQRHVLADGQDTSDLATEAAKIALKQANINAEDVDLIIVATVTPDHPFPATAARVQAKLAAHKAFAFDVNAVCSGFIYALSIADQYLKNGTARRALVIGADAMSKILDWSDRTTAVLFGDGAGALVLEAVEASSPDYDRGIYSTHLFSNGKHYDLLYVDNTKANAQQAGHVRMQGREIFKYAIKLIGEAVETVLKSNNLTIDEIDWFVPHQANLRIIEGISTHFKIPMEKMVVTIAKHSNTSAATIPLALWEAVKDGRIRQNQKVILEAMGGGLTWASALLKW